MLRRRDLCHRVAFWTWWRFLGLSKGQWDGIHIVSGLVFIVMGGLHLYLNWRPFINHLRTRLAKGVKLRKELALSSAIIVLLVLGSAFNIPPVSYLLDLNEHLKRSWVTDKADMPPFGHAEMKSLKVFCQIRQIDLGAAMARLKKRKIRVSSPDATIAAIARSNHITPSALYKIIRTLEPPGMRRTGRGRGMGAGGRGRGR